jgi:hypothetical protein
MGMMEERFMSLQESSACDNLPYSVIYAIEWQIFKVNAYLPNSVSPATERQAYEVSAYRDGKRESKKTKNIKSYFACKK